MKLSIALLDYDDAAGTNGGEPRYCLGISADGAWQTSVVVHLDDERGTATMTATPGAPNLQRLWGYDSHLEGACMVWKRICDLATEQECAFYSQVFIDVTGAHNDLDMEV